MNLSIIILAAGKGKRMGTECPKVLHKIGGLSLLEHVIRVAFSLQPQRVVVVYGNGGAQVRQSLQQFPVQWVEQLEQKGTGHAVLQALPLIEPEGRVLVLYGDVPLLTITTLQHFLGEVPSQDLGFLVAEVPDPTGLGRIVRKNSGQIHAIIEHKDASAEELQIREINTGILIAPAEGLQRWLPKLTNDNRQGEYYLTDVVKLAATEQTPVHGVRAAVLEEVQGINDLWELARLERYYQRETARRLALSGVLLQDPARFDVRGEIEVAANTEIDVNVILEGRVKIGAHCKIGPNVYLRDVVIEDYVEVRANSVVEDSTIRSHCIVGPFARLRPGTEMKMRSEIGSFVETKKIILGENSKAHHLTYLGDATIGSFVNIGAGTITCNYDGAAKHPTVIGDGAFIGSNTALVAPVTVGNNATIGAGSTITRDVEKDMLCLARSPQRVVSGWQRPKKKTEKL